MKLRRRLEQVVHIALPMTNPKTNLSLQAAKRAVPAVQNFQRQNPLLAQTLMSGQLSNSSPMAINPMGQPMRTPAYGAPANREGVVTAPHLPFSPLDFLRPLLGGGSSSASPMGGDRRQYLYGRA